MSVNKERVQLLIDALESGVYKQGVFALSRVLVPDELREDCCLGVACYVARDNGQPLNMVPVLEGKIKFDEDVALMPSRVQTWYGFASRNPIVRRRTEDSLYPLTALNDGYDMPRHSFSQIADALRYTFIEGHEPTEVELEVVSRRVANLNLGAFSEWQ